ncbi:hypothetical protein [Chryseobacterium sp.]|jgi:hypothetical protein|uniref:hypothetical protein n=1 Tax=Chryseobacterium sp. TaxID=1871047 RepID=UPI002FCA2DC7
MKKIILPFILAVTLSAPLAAQKTSVKAETSSAKSQISAQTVIDNYRAALGGREKLEAVKTVILENTMTVQSMEIKMTTKKMGNKFKSVQSVMGQEMTQVFDGVKGYFEQMGTKMDIPADKIEDLKKSKVIDALSYDASTFTAVTSEQIDGKKYNILNSEKGKFFFDANTGLLYKSETKEGNAIIKNYITVDGIKFAEQIDAEGNGQQVKIITTKVTLNSGVSDADFKIN